MNYQALIDELRKPAYQGLSDQAAADLLNALTVQVRRMVPTSEIIQHATQNRYRSKLELAKLDPLSPCRDIAIDILAYIDSPKTSNVDMDLPETKQMLGAMVACGFASQETVGKLEALANVTIKWTESVGLPELGVGLVRNARKMIGGSLNG
jgi:hypothetical protein